MGFFGEKIKKKGKSWERKGKREGERREKRKGKIRKGKGKGGREGVKATEKLGSLKLTFLLPETTKIPKKIFAIPLQQTSLKFSRAFKTCKIYMLFVVDLWKIYDSERGGREYESPN